ncbi:ATP-dependent DNA helicase [Xylophilus sp.]|uniref:ATP-dependent DNA helicase n=1 Tax=Xylophilus sp. TaxID=2653893 RepID=UPI0013BB0E48|nr:ATP-dependent DNA helicase [Xylophilus sp.]KAF1046518.1 MAG: putative ATP-dependent helicase DinG [Xylophilus sp.]
MSHFTTAVAGAFDEGGLLSSAIDAFRPRPGQQAMAVAVAEAIEQGGALVVEAGTGVGKTFSYLVPALLSGERVLLSTATKTLQDQLFSRDLPRLAEALGLPLRSALLKGRSSYLCLHRLQHARQAAGVDDAAARRGLARVERWSLSTRSGDLAELPGLDDRSPLIPLVTSTRENCLGAACPSLRSCHVNLARREALAADVVVVNHHLFFADLAVRESGMAELLPTVRVVVFDEAHQLNETGVQFLGLRLGTGQLLDFARDVLAAGLEQARGLVDWPGVAAAVDTAARDLRMAAGRLPAGTRLRWLEDAPEGVEPQGWQDALHNVHAACVAAAEALDTVSELAPEFVRLGGRAATLAARTLHFAAPPDGAGAVRWADVGLQLALMESPLDIADTVRSRLLGTPAVQDGPALREEPTAAPERERPTAAPERGRAWIFTSATLGDDPALRWFVEPCGLESARVLRVDSPFDYARQAALYVPRTLPRPADPAHGAAVARLAGDAALRLRGRTLVLTTTLKALRAIGEALQQRFPSGGAIEVLVQGQGAKRVLMERFREGDAGGRLAGCVLVASASFWEGVDVPGDALQLVVIDKLPFPPPGDPVVEARSQQLESEGRSPFADYALPEAAITLKQGAGRLIRSETDRGILVVGDVRLSTMGYGKRLLRALPPMRRLQSQEEFDAALDQLTDG